MGADGVKPRRKRRYTPALTKANPPLRWGWKGALSFLISFTLIFVATMIQIPYALDPMMHVSFWLGYATVVGTILAASRPWERR